MAIENTKNRINQLFDIKLRIPKLVRKLGSEFYPSKIKKEKEILMKENISQKMFMKNSI